MADYAQNIKAYLQAQPSVAALVASRIHHNNMPTIAETNNDYIWFNRAGHVYDRTLDEAAGTEPRSVLFNMECCSRDLGRAAALADAVRNLFPFSGTFGDDTLKGAFANDQSEDYVPINEASLVGVHVESLQLEICP
jgi:hypothetical protein